MGSGGHGKQWRNQGPSHTLIGSPTGPSSTRLDVPLVTSSLQPPPAVLPADPLMGSASQIATFTRGQKRTFDQANGDNRWCDQPLTAASSGPTQTHHHQGQPVCFVDGVVPGIHSHGIDLQVRPLWRFNWE